MKILALDIGTRRTGVAYFDDATDIVMPLTTLTHMNEEELLTAVDQLARERDVHDLVAGMPYLPSGKSGSQAVWVEKMLGGLRALGYTIETLDERYTSRPSDKDPDAQAAVTILQTYLDIRAKNSGKNTI